jgi:hypothetical protein
MGRYIGKIISKTGPTVSRNSASGIWSLTEHAANVRNEVWPGFIPPSLYTFTSATFSPGGTTGLDGPSLTQARNGLSGPEANDWKNNTEFFNTTNGIQLWTVPADGTYRIRAMGASAGRTPSYTGGRGVIIQADVSLIAGEVIRILVGQGGTGKSDDCNAGAGGGTFVVRTPYNTNESILVIAGGGGGTARVNGLDAVTTNNGGSATSGTAGGTGGQGGGVNQGPSGAGFFGNGQKAQWGSLGGVNDGEARSFVNGGQGGSSVRQSPNVLGGFGGAASGHGNCCIGGGGGGGYSGGGAATSCQGGGGGSSYIISTATNVATSNGLYNNNSSFNGQAMQNLNQWNTQGPATSGQFAPSGQVIITLI